MVLAPASTFWYLKELPMYEHTKPYIINLPLSHVPQGKRSNQECGRYPGTRLHDIRTETEPLTLDQNGFEHSKSIPLSISYEEFRDSAKVKDDYCEGVRTALLEMTGAEHGHVIHHAIRRRHMSFPEKPRGSAEAETDQPIQGVHCDFTPLQAYRYLKKFFGDGSDTIWKNRRVQILQVWRPLRGPVMDWPLGVCDTRTVNEDADLVATDNIWTYTVSESYNVYHRPAHKWYYIHEQGPDDVLLFKGYDNAEGVATSCPHAAFELEDTTSMDGHLRESIECAILLVYPIPVTKP